MESLFNKEAEDATIGSILIGGLPSLDEALEILAPSDFYQHQHEDILNALLKLSQERTPFDIITVANSLKNHKIVNIPYLTLLAAAVPTSNNLKYYAEIVKKYSLIRQGINHYQECIQRLKSGEDPQEVMSQDMIFISELNSNIKREVVHIGKKLTEIFDKIEERYHKKSIRGISTGFDGLDKIIGGLREDALIILAGRPGTGKTTFALQIAKNIAENYSVYIGSLEMSVEQLSEKLLANEAGVNSRKLDNGTINDQDWPKLAQALGIISNKQIYIDDSVDMKASQIAIRIRRLKALCDIKLAIIDYLQLIEPEKELNNRNAEITKTLKIFKKLTRELKIPILLLSQLNRAIEGRKEKKPTMADLRDSGSIEQDASVIMFLYPENEEAVDQDICKVNNLTAKNRFGPADCKLEFVFDKPKSKFILN